MNNWKLSQTKFDVNGSLIPLLTPLKEDYNCYNVTQRHIWQHWNVFDSWNTICDAGISDVTEAYLAAIKGATADSHEVLPQTSIHDKANLFSEHLRADQTTAVNKIQDGLQYLSFVVVSTTMPAAWKLVKFSTLTISSLIFLISF